MVFKKKKTLKEEKNPFKKKKKNPQERKFGGVGPLFLIWFFFFNFPGTSPKKPFLFFKSPF